MKKHLFSLAIFTFFLMIIPCLAIFIRPQYVASNETHSVKTNVQKQNIYSSSSQDNKADVNYSEDTFLVKDYQSGEIITVSARDYVIGAVCAEMPASFNEEALKAQAVAAHTYAIRQRERELKNPTPELNGAYFSNDPQYYQAFFTNDQIKQFYGDNYEANYNKIAKCVDAVMDKVLYYNNEPIVAAFHAISGGKTEDASIIWGSNVSYLVPVDSSSDKNAPNYQEEKTFTCDEIKARLTTQYPDIKLGSDKSKWLKVIETSSSGTVTSMIAGDRNITGMDFRTLLSLRSPDFSIEYTDNAYKITTRGHGHGVGLSQYGANALAQSGKTYDEILLYYYKGVEIKTV